MDPELIRSLVSEMTSDEVVDEESSRVFGISSLVASVKGAWQEGDIYLQLSAVGVTVLMVLCGLICVAWLYYGSVISTVFDGRNKVGIQQQFSEEKLEQPMIRSASYFVPWQDGAFPLSPETRRIDVATKKQN